MVPTEGFGGRERKVWWESGVVMHQGHPEREERARASEVCSSAGREWQLLYNNGGPAGEMEEALQ